LKYIHTCFIYSWRNLIVDRSDTDCLYYKMHLVIIEKLKYSKCKSCLSFHDTIYHFCLQDICLDSNDRMFDYMSILQMISPNLLVLETGVKICLVFVELEYNRHVGGSGTKERHLRSWWHFKVRLLSSENCDFCMNSDYNLSSITIDIRKFSTKKRIILF
jgi:hypothetical protein